MNNGSPVIALSGVVKTFGHVRALDGLDFTVDEGTWTSLDVSTDGKWIVFDLLSQIYRVPAAGGPYAAGSRSSLTASSNSPIGISPL